MRKSTYAATPASSRAVMPIERILIRPAGHVSGSSRCQCFGIAALACLCAALRYGERSALLPLVLLLAAVTPAQGDERVSVAHPIDASVYARAERFLPWHHGATVFNNEIDHHWIGDADALWYQRARADGWRYLVAEPAARRIRDAFDHERMARALGAAISKQLEPARLPITRLEFVRGSLATPRVWVNGRAWDCDLLAAQCVEVAAQSTDACAVCAADGHACVVTHGANLWLHDRQIGTTRPLTTDGQPQRAYGAWPQSSGIAVTQQRGSACVPPAGSFSPDGTKFVSYLLDESAVPELNLLQHVPEDGSFRPRLWTFRYPLPGDPQPHAQLIVFDLRSQRAIAVDHPPMLAQVYGPIGAEQVTWSSDSRKLFIVDNRRGYHELTWTEADALSGITRPLIVEQGSGSVLAEARGQDAPTRVMLASGDFIWTSERSGWRHLYYYDRSGRERRALTSGAWVVREILRVDEATRTIFFTAAGKEPGEDPYLRQVYQVRFDGTGLRRMTPEPADHWVKIARTDARLVDPSLPGTGQGGFSVSGRFFVDSFAAPDRATVTVIRDRRGRSVLTLETATLAPDLAAHYVPPEPFSVLAADGTTVLWGSLFRPSDFDPTRSYPVIDSVYPGPQQTRVSKRFMNDSAQAIAELGFIVVALDARGTPLRSRAFREASYGNLAAAGSLDDHVAAIRTLARTRPYLDVTRVGVYGGSAGGFATVHALLDYPDFFKVGVAYTGNHDLRSYLTVWAERYQGDFDAQGYARAASYTNAAQLQGKLLLVHGDMDDNVPPANTLRVVDALIRNNKSFDLLILPNVNHAGVSQHPYFIRRLWDYFVTYLAQAVPPADYVIQGPVPQASQP